MGGTRDRFRSSDSESSKFYGVDEVINNLFIWLFSYYLFSSFLEERWQARKPIGKQVKHRIMQEAPNKKGSLASSLASSISFSIQQARNKKLLS